MENAVKLPTGWGDPTLYVIIALVLFFLMLMYFGIHKKIASSLDARADKIRAELDEARRLREEAQALLASYQANAEVQALAEVRGRAADIALDAAQDLLKQGLSSAEKAKLVKSGISSMGDMLN